MSSGKSWNRCQALIVVTLLVGCLQTAPTMVEDHSALLVVAHMSEGQAPTMKALSLKPNGDFTYGYVGLKSRRGTLSAEDIRAIKDLIQRLRGDELQSSDRAGMDQEQIVIGFDQRQIIFSTDDVPGKVRELLRILDAAAGTELGKKYEPFASVLSE